MPEVAYFSHDEFNDYFNEIKYNDNKYSLPFICINIYTIGYECDDDYVFLRIGLN